MSRNLPSRKFMSCNNRIVLFFYFQIPLYWTCEQTISTWYDSLTAVTGMWTMLLFAWQNCSNWRWMSLSHHINGHQQLTIFLRFFFICLSSLKIPNGSRTKSWVIMETFWSTTRRRCWAGETKREDESTWRECVSLGKFSLTASRPLKLVSFSAQAGNLNLIDLAQLDDLWFEAMFNEIETIENGIVVLIDMSGSVSLQLQ